MPRAKRQPLPNEHLSSRTWTRHSNYVLVEHDSSKLNAKDEPIVTTRKLIEAQGESKPGILLSEDQSFDELASEYAGIETEHDALDWCAKFGLPISNGHSAMGLCDFVYVDDFLGSAASVRWLMELIEKTVNNPPALADNSKISDLETHWIITFAPVRLKNWCGVYHTRCNKSAETTTEIFGCPDRDRTSPSPFVLSYEKSSRFYKTYSERERIQFAAKEYLRRVFNKVITGVFPVLEWRQDQYGEFDLVSAFAVTSPWQAIHLKLFQQLAGVSNLRKCRRPDCETYFFRKRGDKEYCTKDACRKWCNDHGYAKLRSPRNVTSKAED